MSCRVKNPNHPDNLKDNRADDRSKGSGFGSRYKWTDCSYWPYPFGVVKCVWCGEKSS